MRLIDGDALVGRDGLFSKRGCGGRCQYCNLWSAEGCRVILEAPTVDAVDVVHGWWNSICRGKMLECSNCKTAFDNTCNYIEEEWHYCPNCGAHMDLEETE